MKTKINLILAMMFIGILSLSAEETKTEKFKVYGNCGMCEARIEKAVNAVEGVTSAQWDSETKMIEVSFDDAKTDLNKIQKAIANVGHDTELFTAKDEVYDKLHGCCQYDRPEKKAKDEIQE